jgi:hypothetical protein
MREELVERRVRGEHAVSKKGKNLNKRKRRKKEQYTPPSGSSGEGKAELETVYEISQLHFILPLNHKVFTNRIGI